MTTLSDASAQESCPAAALTARFIAPTTTDFAKIRGTIQDGVEMRCGQCRCQCVCMCPSSCKNCKHHIDAEFLREFAAR